MQLIPVSISDLFDISHTTFPYKMQVCDLLSAGLEGVVLSSSCAQLWAGRGHHL